MNRIGVLITGPSLQDPGGVANYYNAVLPFLKADRRLDVRYFEIGSTQGNLGILHPLSDQMSVRRALRQFAPAVVHVNPSLTLKSFLRDGLIVHQARRLGIPVIVFFRGWDEGVEAMVDSYLGWFFRMTYARANAFVVLASRFRHKLIQWGVTSPIEIGTTTVPDGLLDDFSIADKTAYIRQGSIEKILFMARLEKKKGVIETLEAAASLLRQGLPVSLTIAGDGPALREVRQFVAARDVPEDRIDIIGYISGQQKREVLAAHHVYCFPSEYGEGMPNSVLEAMAFGMPIVACAVGGLADFFEDGRMGYLVERRNVAQIVEKLRILVNDRETAVRMAEYNHRYAKARFLASDVAGRLGTMYCDIAPQGMG